MADIMRKLAVPGRSKAAAPAREPGLFHHHTEEPARDWPVLRAELGTIGQ